MSESGWEPPDVIPAGDPMAPWCGWCGTEHTGENCPTPDDDPDDDE